MTQMCSLTVHEKYPRNGDPHQQLSAQAYYPDVHPECDMNITARGTGAGLGIRCDQHQPV